MGALRQYIELYDANLTAIDAGSAGVLNALRPTAYNALAGRELPRRGDEDFEKTSVDKMFEPDYGLNINRVKLPCDIASAFKCGVPNATTLLAVMVGDIFVPTPTLKANIPAGVTMMSLAEAARRYPDVVERYYGTVAPLDNVGVALNTLLTQDGVFIRLERGVKLDKPLQLVTLNAAPVPMLTPMRILVVAEEGSQASILVCDHSVNHETESLTSRVIEVIASRDAHIDFCDIEETHPANRRYSQLFARLEDGANVSIGGMTLYNGVSRNEYTVEIVGKECECHLNGMAIGSSTQHIDNYSNVRHLSGGSRSHQLFKYVMDDKSTGAFEGSIEVATGARFTDASQTDRNILASPHARMHSKPRLLIYNDDVKCSHGATTGQLDERALFYMQSRGIPRNEARMMLMQAFLAEVVESVRVDSVRDRLRHLVERRMAGRETRCENCNK